MAEYDEDDYVPEEDDESALEAYARTNKYLNKKLLKGIVGLSDLPELLHNAISYPSRKIDSLVTGKPVKPGIKGDLSGLIKKGLKKYAGTDLDEPYKAKGNGALSSVANAAVRTAGHGAEWVGSSLIGPAKYIKSAGALGATSGALQEAGVPSSVADLGVIAASLGGPAGYKAFMKRMSGEKTAAQGLVSTIGEKNVPKVLKNIDKGLAKSYPAGFAPTTAGIANNTGLSVLHQGKSGLVNEEAQKLAAQEAKNREAINESIQSLEPKSGATIENTQKHLKKKVEGKKEKLEKISQETMDRRVNKLESEIEAFPHHAESHLEAGGKIRGRLKREVEKIRKERYEKTNDIYEGLKKRPERVEPSNTFKYIQDEFGLSRGEKAAMGEKAKKGLETKVMPEGTLSPARQAHADKLKETAPELYEGFVKKYMEPGANAGNPTVGEMIEMRMDLNKSWQKAARSGDENKQRIIGNLIENIDSDIYKADEGVLSLLAANNKVYGEFSDKINKITKHPSMGSAVNYDKLAKRFTSREAQIADKFTKGKTSLEDARDLKAIIGDDKSVIPAMQEHINKSVIDNIIDPNTGKVNARKLHNWKQNNPGAFELYNGLDIKLNNVSNANAFVNQAEKRFASYKKNLNENLASDLLNENVSKVVPKVFASDNPLSEIKNIKKLVGDDPTGAAWEGVQGLFAKDLSDKISTFAHGKTGTSFPKYDKYMNKNKAALKEVFDPDQIKVVDSIGNALKANHMASTLGRAEGSPSYPKLMNEFKANGPTILNKILASKGFGDLAKIETIINPGKSGLTAIGINIMEKLRLKNLEQVTNKALMDPSFAKLLLTDPRNKSAVKNAFEDVLKSGKSTAFPAANLYNESSKPDKPIEQEDWIYEEPAEEEISTEEDY